MSEADASLPTILLVDDEPMILSALCAAFELEGDCRVLAFGDPEDALDHLREHGADLIISDFLMPGIDGIELLRRARALDPLVPRILLTGYADKESAMRAINEAGIFQYVEKPWSCADFRIVLRNALERRLLLRSLSTRASQLARANAHLDELRGELLRTFG